MKAEKFNQKRKGIERKMGDITEEKLKEMKEEELAYPEGKMERVGQKHLVAVDGSPASNDAFYSCVKLMEKEMVW